MRDFGEEGGGREGGTRQDATSSGVADEYGFLVGRLISAETLAQVIADASASGATPLQEMIAHGWISATDYVAALAVEIERLVGPVRTSPLAGAAPTRSINATAAGPRTIAFEVSAARARGEAPLLMAGNDMAHAETDAVRSSRAAVATERLHRLRPDLSAKSAHANWQLLLVPAGIGLACGALGGAPEIAVPVVAGLVTVPFFALVCLRVTALVQVLAGSAGRRRRRRRRDTRWPGARLPIYTILVPLYHEADVLPGLVEALNRLDYPRAKLDVILVLESTDPATQEAALALDLPPFIRTVIVPPIGPRTKPKALNFAMQFARGTYVVVFDAEDEPEPDQLLKALAAFEDGPPGLGCVQARLNIYNANSGWLARQFTLEYSALFDAMLPTLIALGLPSPLGGTSNHFPRSVVERLNLWDPHNVTEDADLGIRLAREGLKVALLDSTTFEEAPPRFSIWLPQRTRWLKGFIQTWLVHMRRPSRLLAELGVFGFLGFHAFVGGVVVSALLHPIFLGLLAVQMAGGAFLLEPASWAEAAILSLATFNLVAGYVSGMVLGAVAAVRRGMPILALHALAMPFYWLLISFAAWRAVVQLWRDPYLWEKTPHAPRRPGRSDRASIRRI